MSHAVTVEFLRVQRAVHQWRAQKKVDRARLDSSDDAPAERPHGLCEADLIHIRRPSQHREGVLACCRQG
jgi:hypothetical protein